MGNLREMTDGTILAQIPSPGPAPYGIAHDGDALWVSDPQEKKIFRVDPNGGNILFSIAFDGDLAGTGWDGKCVWQGDRTSRTISQIDPETGEITKALKVEHPVGEIGGVCCEGEHLWYGLARLGQLRKVKQADGGYAKAYPVKPDCCGVLSVGKHLFYTEPGAGLVHKMDAATGSLLISYNVGGRPTGLAHDGHAFWLADQEQKRIMRIRF